MEIHSGQAGIDDASLYYEEAGRGFPIVFIHGADSDHTLWDEQFTIFAREYRAIRYDLRGCGRSITNPVPSSHANDLLMLLQHRGVEQAFLVGCGLGAQIAIDFALARPRQAASLVLVNPSAREPGTSPLGLIPNTGAPNSAGSYNIAFRDEQDNILPIEPATVRRLRQLNVPSLVITGENAHPDVIRAALLLYNTIPDVIKANLPGAGQFPNRERTTQFNRILLTFFDWIKSRWEGSRTDSW